MLLKDLFKTMAERAGVLATEAKFKVALDAIPADLDVDDDAVAKLITGNLITEAEAESRPKIKNKFVAETLNGIDSLLDPALVDFFDQPTLDGFKTDKSTQKKITKLIAKAQELQRNAKPGDATELHNTITKLNEQLASVKADNDSTVNSLKETHQKEIDGLKTDYSRRLYMNGLAGKVIARNDVTEFAKGKEGKRVLNDFEDYLDSVKGVLNIETGMIMQKADPNQHVFIDNKQATADMILDKTLVDNGYIKKSDGPPPKTVITTEGGEQQENGQQNIAASRNANRLAQG